MLLPLVEANRGWIPRTGVTDRIDCLQYQMAAGDESCVLSAKVASAAEAAGNAEDVEKSL